MGWTDEVHQQRLTTAVSTARRDRQLKRNGAQVLRTANTGPGAFTIALSAATAFIAFRKFEKQIKQVQWTKLPVIAQFHALLAGDAKPSPARAAAGSSSASRPKQRVPASPATVSASGRAKPVAKVSNSRNGSSDARVLLHINLLDSTG